MLKIGDILGGIYEITDKIGSGGGGIIFKANHLRMKKTVALKLIKEDVKGIIENRAEVDILKNLKNDYLPQVLDFVEDNDDVYTVMEFIEGQDLSLLVKSGKQFDEKSVIRYAVQLCSAVEYLHSQNPPIIHSDIKPANIMLTPNDKICLIDFNISSITNGDGAYSMGGSKGFAAPEQFRKIIDVPLSVDEFHEQTRFINDDELAETMVDTEVTATLIDDKTELLENENKIDTDEKALTAKTKDMNKAYIDTRTDIYGIGASLYYIVTSRLPVGGNLDFRGIKISKRLKRIIEKAMAQNPDERYKSVSEMKKDIENNGTVKLNLKALIAASAAVVAIIATIILYPIIHVEMNTKALAYSYGNEFVIEKAPNKEILGQKLSNKYNATAVNLMQQLYNYYSSLDFNECLKYLSVSQDVINKIEESTGTDFNIKFSSPGAIGKLDPSSGEVVEYLYNNFTNYTGKDELYISYSISSGKIAYMYVSDDPNLYEAMANGVTIQGKLGVAITTDVNDIGLADFDSSILDLSLYLDSVNFDIPTTKIEKIDAEKLGESLKIPSLKLSDDLGEDVEVNGKHYYTSYEEIFIGNILNGADLSSLTKLTNLKKISFDYGATGIDFSAFPELPTVEEIDLTYSEISSLKGIADKFPNIKVLNITGTDLSDLSPLANLKYLHTLDMSVCQSMSDLSPISNLKNLKNLDIHDCESITDLSPIAGIKGIEILDISYITFDDNSFMDVILNFLDLKSLNASAVRYKNGSHDDGSEKTGKITDISGFERFTDLEELNLIGAELSDISPLFDLKEMKNLYLDSRDITDFSAIRNMTKLEKLQLEIGCYTDWSILKNHTNIQELKIYYVKNYIDGIYQYPYVNSTELLSYISKMNSLEVLTLNYVKLSDSDVYAICNMKSLKNLYLITDISSDNSSKIKTSLADCNVTIHREEFKTEDGGNYVTNNSDDALDILSMDKEDVLLYIANEVVNGNKIDPEILDPEYSYSNINAIGNYSAESDLSDYMGQYVKDYMGWSAGILWKLDTPEGTQSECDTDALAFLSERFPNEDNNKSACLIIYESSFYLYMGNEIEIMADLTEGVGFGEGGATMMDLLSDATSYAEVIYVYYAVLMYYAI